MPLSIDDTTPDPTTDDRGALRSQDEIVARIKALDSDDVFGFAREVLLDALDFEHAKPYLLDGVTADEWNGSDARPADIADAALYYFTFALGKIRSHRGISAERSVVKLREWAWLLGRDDAIQAMDAAWHPQYGAPKLKALARVMGWAWPPAKDAPMLDRMASGLPCSDDCQEGCGR